MDVEEKVESFKVADTNHDGVLSETEFDLRGTTVRTHILKLNLDSYDNDKNGSVELREFSAHLDNTEEIDADGDGNISREELLGSSDVKLQLQLDVQINQSAAFDRARAVESQSQ